MFASIAANLSELGLLPASGEEKPEDALLRDLERGRTGEMRDIVQTIQAAQDAIVRSDPDQVLVVRGLGTGKTAVALHRVSWLLYNYADSIGAADVLVVGPSPVFTRYIRTVLPSLGDIDVSQLSMGQLGPESSRGGSEPPEIARLKGRSTDGGDAETRRAPADSRTARR